jgi:hypothetical protein
VQRLELVVHVRERRVYGVDMVDSVGASPCNSRDQLGDVWRFAHDGAQVTAPRAALLPASRMYGPDRTDNA